MWRVMADIEMDDAEHRFRRRYRDRFQIEDLRDGNSSKDTDLLKVFSRSFLTY